MYWRGYENYKGLGDSDMKAPTRPICHSDDHNFTNIMLIGVVRAEDMNKGRMKMERK
jgi:hypothetical protein